LFLFFVMAGLSPAIHAFVLAPKKGMDTRAKRGHDGIGTARICIARAID
jgi:hypothetical protein